MSEFTRRDFLNRSTQGGLTLAAGSAIAATTGQTLAGNQSTENKGPKIATFTKSFQDRSIPEVCRIFKQIGLDGLDLTVRPGGHIDPKDAPIQLPKAVKAARDNGVEILQLTTAITDVDADAQRILSTAGELGIDRIKMGYYRYTQFGKLAKQMDDVRRRVASVIKLARRFKVLPCIHIHSGAFIPSHGTMLYALLRDFSPQEVGAYVDPLHMTLEGGRDGWRQGIDLLARWIALSSVKNFIWEQGERDKKGQMRWHTRLVACADGIAPLPDFVASLKQIGYQGGYSLHSEYKGRHSFKNMTTDECIVQTAKDLKFFRALL